MLVRKTPDGMKHRESDGPREGGRQNHKRGGKEYSDKDPYIDFNGSKPSTAILRFESLVSISVYPSEVEW